MVSRPFAVTSFVAIGYSRGAVKAIFLKMCGFTKNLGILSVIARNREKHFLAPVTSLPVDVWSLAHWGFERKLKVLF